MAFQLVYTSAAKLLDAGRSGYGTVARSKSITPLVVSAIERVSQFANQRGLDRHRVIHVHRRITAGSNRFHVLTRIVDAGADYTGRTNHLAHHLVVSQEEAARAAARGVTPADVLRQFPWLGRWDESARFFDASEDVALEDFMPDGKDSKRQSWTSVTGNPAHARLLSFDGAPRTGVLIVPEGVDPLVLLTEALSEFGPQSWSRSFTTSLETTDELSDLEWIVTTPAAFPEIQPRCGSRTLLDLTNPAILPIPPSPTLPAPQLAPTSGPPNGPGVYITRAPDLTTRQSSSNSVQVRVAETGARAAAASLRRSNPKEDKKTRIKLVVGLTALLLCVGLLAFVATRDKKNGDIAADSNEGNKPTEPKLNDSQMQVVKNLGEIGIMQPDAERLVMKAGDKAQAWAIYVIDSNKQLAEFSDPQSSPELTRLPSPPDVRQPPGSPAGSPDWLESLVSGTVKLRNLGSGVERFKNLNDAVESLRNALTSGGLPKLKQVNPDAEDMFCKIANPWLTEIMKGQRFDDFESVLNVPGIWDKSTYPKRYEILAAAIRGTSDKEKNPGLDSDKLLELLRKNTQFAGILDSIRPKTDIEISAIRGRAEPNPPVVKEAVFGSVPDKQIILVSKANLKSGVKVELLKAIMDARLEGKKLSKLKVEDFVVTIGPSSAPEQVELFLSDEGERDFYCRTLLKDHPDPRYYIDGRFAVPRDDTKRVDLGFGKYSATILIDEKSSDVFDNSLKFKIIEKQGRGATLPLPLVERIDQIVPKETRESLRFEIVSQPPGTLWNAHFDNSKWTLNRIPNEVPLLFSVNDIEILTANLEALKINLEGIHQSQNGSEEKKRREREVSGIVTTLRSSFCVALGGGFLLRELSLESPELITKDRWDQTKDVYNRLYPNIERGEFKDKEDWAKDIADIKNRIGETKLDEVIKSNSSSKYSNPKTWEDLAKSPTSVIGFVNDLIIKSKNYIREEPLSDALNKIQSITVVSAKGRVLLNATKEP